MTNNPTNKVGQDKFGNDIFVSTRPDGLQVWSQSRNGIIQNGGLNETPWTLCGFEKAIIMDSQVSPEQALIMDSQVSPEQAFLAMFSFLEDYYNRTGSDDVGSLLGSMSLMDNGKPMDIAMWHEWLECISKSQSGHIDANMQITDKEIR